MNNPAAFAQRHPLRRWRRHLLILLPLLAATALAVTWQVGSELIAPARRPVGQPPRAINAHSILLRAHSGAAISGWHSVPADCRGAVVLVHGIRANRLVMLDRARMLHDAGFATIMIDLQAHGESNGEQITLGALEQYDVRAAVEFAQAKHPDLPLAVIGVSMGGAATVLASPLPVHAVVLESVFPEIRSAIHNRVAARLGPLAAVPTQLLLAQLQFRLGIPPDSLRPLDRMPQLGCPVLILSGADDSFTPATATQELFAAAREPKQLLLMEGAGHVDLCQHAPTLYRNTVLPFLEQHLHSATAESSDDTQSAH